MLDALQPGDEEKALSKAVHKYTQTWWTQDDERITEVQEIIKYSNERSLKLKTPTSFDWFSTDTKSLYKENVEQCRDAMEDFGWLKPENQFKYDFNQYGFRDEEFTEYPESWVAVGECFTFGTALPRHLTWPHILEEKYGTKVWNLGQCTTGFDSAFRAILAHIDQLKPQKVLLLEPVPITRELYQDMKPTLPGGWSSVHWMKAMSEDKVERYISRIKNFYAVKSLLEDKGIELLFISSEDRHDIGIKSWLDKSSGEFAASRDLMHPGSRFHELIADRWSEIIDGK